MANTATAPPVHSPTLSFSQAVEALKRTAEGERRTALDQGDIVLAAVPWNAPDAPAQIKALAEASGLDEATLGHRRRVAYRVRPEERNGMPWVAIEAIAAAEDDLAEHSRLLRLFGRANPDRPDGKWTRAAVRRAQGQVVGHTSTAGDLDRDLPVPEKVAAIRAFFSNAEVREQVMADPATRAGVARAVEEHNQASLTRVERIRQEDPVSRYLDAQSALLAITKLMSDFAIDAAYLLPRLPALPPTEGDPHARTWSLHLARRRLSQALAQVDDYLKVGAVIPDVDAVVRRLLSDQPEEDRP